MRKSPIHFGPGMSLPEFQAQYGTEEQCRAAVARLRWPRGVVCPRCGSRGHCVLGRGQYQCNACRHQVSLTAGTIFHATKLPLTYWFLAMYLLSQNKKGISSLALARQLGVSQNTAWQIKHKLMQVMLERESGRRLGGALQVDDAYIGGELRENKRGRGSPNKIPIVAAVQTQRGRPKRLKLSRVRAFSQAEIHAWSRHHLVPGSEVISDGLSCFRAVAQTGCQHSPRIIGSGPRAVEPPEFLWVNTVLGNLKTTLRGTYHAVRGKHVPRYLAEFQYRFNRRHDLKHLLRRLLYAAVRTPPMPYRLLTLAEAHW
jgi:transposase-like protein